MNENEIANVVNDEGLNEELEKAQDTIHKREKRLRRWQRFIPAVIILVIVIWLVFLFVLGLIAMPGSDMTPYANQGDWILFNRLDKNLQAQDVIVLNKNGMRYVGRVMAVGGETVDIPGDGSVIINGNTIDEANITTSTPLYRGYTEFPLTLQEDECFVLADNREGGDDSRYFGPVSRKEIAGTVITVMHRGRS